MREIHLEKDMARLALLQRTELATPIFKKLRKLFGRFIYTNYITKYLIDVENIRKSYDIVMKKELESIKKFLKPGKKYLSIGGGIGGLELLIYNNFNNIFINFIERNYISKKVVYGWDNKNLEGYNNLKCLNNFLESNGMTKKKFNIFDYDKDDLPKEKIDYVISLYSLDYHYDFNIYKDYFNQISDENTQFIFDTIRPDFFDNIFKEMKIIQTNHDTLHKSKRIICKSFIN
jgi:hypothetical protein